MYKIHTRGVGEGGGDTWKLIFSSLRAWNQLILMYYFMQGRVAAAAERVATAVLIGEAIYYTWRLWQLLKERAEGYQAGEATVKKNIREYKLFPGRVVNCTAGGEHDWIYYFFFRLSLLFLKTAVTPRWHY